METQLLENALKALERETGVPAEIARYARGKDEGWDAQIIIGRNPIQEYNAQVKRWAQHREFGTLTYQLFRIPKAILIADYINPNMATKLRQENIEFIDCAGNAYIDRDELKVWVKGNRKVRHQFRGVEQPPFGNEEKTHAKPIGAGALRIIYQFLIEPDILNVPYREIASRAGVALGAIGWVIQALLDEQYINQRGRGRKAHRTINNYDGLLDLFVEHYPRKLKPKLELGNFQLTNKQWYLDFQIAKFNGVWGGEYAAREQTKFLKPQDGTIYLFDENKLTELAAAGRFRKGNQGDGAEGNIQVLKAFWQQDAGNDVLAQHTHPVLTYADLIATGDPRNLETAQLLRIEKLNREIPENDRHQ